MLLLSFSVVGLNLVQERMVWWRNNHLDCIICKMGLCDCMRIRMVHAGVIYGTQQNNKCITMNFSIITLSNWTLFCVMRIHVYNEPGLPTYSCKYK